MSTTEAARHFDETFLTQARKREAELSNITKLATPQEKSQNLNNCLEEIASLQRSVQDASSYSNSHDQAVYAQTLKKLQTSAEAVRNAITPKSKFKFKSARQAPAKAAVNPASSQNVDERDSKGVAAMGRDAEATASSYDILQNGTTAISGAKITISTSRLDELPARAIRNVSNSVIDLTTNEQTPAASLSVTDVSHSILFCGTINGPLHMTSVKSSLVFAKAHQLRIHDCEDVTLYLDVGSQPVIERCRSMRFAPLGGKAREFWSQVLDFQHPGGDSPNWLPIPEEARLKDLQLENGRVSLDGFGSLETQSDLRQKLVAGKINGLADLDAQSENNLQLSPRVM